MTPKQKIVYEALFKIPAGKVVTYGELSKFTWIHPRTIGRLLSQNQEPDVYPCFRVVAFDGDLKGFTLGLAEKERRLKADWVEIVDWKVGEEFFWEF